jgi:hypothetical protein
MRDLLRTLFYEWFAPSSLPLLQRALELSVGTAGLLSAYAHVRGSQLRRTLRISSQ